ncbi:MAG TPA: methyltransferase domain-containing protein [Vicinamibacteria bacterium]
MSLELLWKHRRVWSKKPVLAQVYRPWFEALLAEGPPGARALEVGAGPGFLRELARERRPDLSLTSLDVLPTPWNDLVGDALCLPLRSEAVDVVLGLDVLHHLARPAAFFAETARVLRPGGRLALVEPWVSPFSYPIYRFLHQEGCTLGLDPWLPFGETPGKDAFEGDAAVASGLVRQTPAERWRELGLHPPRTRLLNGFAYLLSLGFKPASLLPRSLAPAAMAVDRALGPAAPLLSLRAFVVWTKA